MHTRSKKRKIAAVVAGEVAIVAGGYFGYDFISRYAHSTKFIDGIRALENNWIGARAFIGAESMELFRAALYLYNIDSPVLNVEMMKNIGTALAMDVISAEIVKAAYTGINLVAGRSHDDIHPIEEVTVEVVGTYLVRAAVNETRKFLHHTFFKHPSEADAFMVGGSRSEYDNITSTVAMTDSQRRRHHDNESTTLTDHDHHEHSRSGFSGPS